VHDVLDLAEDVEAQDLAVILQELLLARDSLIEHAELIHLPGVELNLAGLLKVICRLILFSGLRGIQIHVELSGILIAVIQPHGLPVDNDIVPDDKVLDIDEVIRILGAVPRRLLPLQEGALREPGVHLLRLGDREGSVLEVEVEDQLAETRLLQLALDNGFLEISVEAEDLPVHFNKRWLEELGRFLLKPSFVGALVGRFVHLVNRSFLTWGLHPLLARKRVPDVLRDFLLGIKGCV